MSTELQGTKALITESFRECDNDEAVNKLRRISEMCLDQAQDLNVDLFFDVDLYMLVDTTRFRVQDTDFWENRPDVPFVTLFSLPAPGYAQQARKLLTTLKNSGIQEGIWRIPASGS
jgi:hypothetical protein